MGLEDFSSSKDIPFQVSPDVVSHIKSTIVQRACVETLIALGTSRRLRDVLASIVSLIRQPLDTKEKQFDVELSVSLNCMRDMLQNFGHESRPPLRHLCHRVKNQTKPSVESRSYKELRLHRDIGITNLLLSLQQREHL